MAAVLYVPACVKSQHGPEATSKDSSWLEALVKLFLGVHASPRTDLLKEAITFSSTQFSHLPADSAAGVQAQALRGCSKDWLDSFLRLENTVFLLR